MIRTIHYVAPKVWVWRKNRVKKIKKFIDHILLLFNFEKEYFEIENIKTTFVGHPLIEYKENSKIVSNNLIPMRTEKLFQFFQEVVRSETNVLMPILLDFINLMKKNELYL